MSREFGEYGNCGYFHSKIESAREDCNNGRDELTKLFGALLKELEPVAYQIANSEAGDSGPDAPIFITITQMPNIDESIRAIKQYIATYESVARRAIQGRVDLVKA